MTTDVALILAAGQGKRMRSALPKVLHRIAGRPMIEHVIRAVREAGLSRIIVVVGQAADAVRKALPDDVEAATQVEPRGTADAVRAGVDAIGTLPDGASVVVCHGDCPLLIGSVFEGLVAARAKSGAAIALAVSTVEDPRGYGRVLLDERGGVRSIVEEAVASSDERSVKTINAGVYCFDGAWLARSLSQVEPSPSGEYYLTDLVGVAVRNDRAVQMVDTPIEVTVGVNDRAQLADAERIVRDRIRHHFMISGVTLMDPLTTYIDADVTIGADTVIYPGSILEGETRVGAGVRLGPRAHIIDSTIGDAAVVDAAVIERSIVGAEARVGPFSHLRSGAHLLPGADLGNFAEVKNATIGAGSKMHHFSYVGDAEIGPGVNVGAGTITCNYDAETGTKSRTVVGEGASLGSDTLLIAPVQIGAGAITAAGAVVTRDVEPGVVVVGVPARPARRRRWKTDTDER